MSNCDICLNNSKNLTIINEKYIENDNILIKLQKFVPEVDWKLDVVFCGLCLEELNKIFAFRELCIQSYLSKKNIVDVKNELENDDIQMDICNGSDHSDDEASKSKMKCEHCGKQYISLKRHYSSCKSRIIEDNDLSEYLEMKDKTEKQGCKNDSPMCNLCGTTFCNKYLLKRHLNNVHATEKKFKCDLCDRSFVSPVYLNAHKRYHSGERSHICSFCGKGFITTSDLYHHEKIHANKRSYRCEKCPKAFNTSSDLHKHKICVHSDKSKWKYVCNYCNRRFPLKINMDTHIKTHTGEKNFPCKLCGRKFVNNSVLMRHMETHTNTVSYKCDICLQGYKYQKSLEMHQAKVHGIGKAPEKVKKFFCHVCPKSYYESNKLEKHIRSHTGEKPFQCPSCDKTFIDKSYVKQHLKTMHCTLKTVVENC